MTDITPPSSLRGDHIYPLWKNHPHHHIPINLVVLCSLFISLSATSAMASSSSQSVAALFPGGARRLKMKRPENVDEAQSRQFAKTMEGRVLNPVLQADKVKGLVGFMPSEAVLSTISFWVKIDGLMLWNWHEDTLTDIGADLGIVQAVNFVETKVRITVDCDKPLVFAMELEYDDEGQNRNANRRSDWDRNERRDGPKDRRNRRFGDERLNNQFNRFKGDISQVQEGQRVETQRDPPYQRKLQRQLLPEFTAAAEAEKRDTREWVERSFGEATRKVPAPGERELRQMTEKARIAARAAVVNAPTTQAVTPVQAEGMGSGQLQLAGPI
ncbi:unnamed protein product [Cochlearia groenlandica]